MVYAFMSKEYYDTWAEEERLCGKIPSPIQFMKEFGTPLISLVYPEKDGNYIKLEDASSIEVRYSYFVDLKRRFPSVCL
jgi:hypothetical protein